MACAAENQDKNVHAFAMAELLKTKHIMASFGKQIDLIGQYGKINCRWPGFTSKNLMMSTYAIGTLANGGGSM